MNDVTKYEVLERMIVIFLTMITIAVSVNLSVTFGMKGDIGELKAIPEQYRQLDLKIRALEIQVEVMKLQVKQDTTRK